MDVAQEDAREDLRLGDEVDADAEVVEVAVLQPEAEVGRRRGGVDPDRTAREEDRGAALP